MENKALIIKLLSGVYTIYDLNTKEIFDAKPRGTFRKEDLIIKVGDYVTYEKDHDAYIITKVWERHSDLIRPQIANIDQGFIVFSVKDPVLNLNLLDKFLLLFTFHDIKPIIVFTKMDLLNDEEKEEVSKIASYYRSIGYDLYETSTINDESAHIEDLFKDKISVLTGQSGVGKSSLLNMIEEEFNLETNEISKALNRGKHTTRHIELYPLKGGWIADTPGFGTISLSELSDSDVAMNFTEFFKLSEGCKYNCCLHLNEPGCKVKEALNNGEILRSRYDNYVLFINDLRKERAHDYRTINLKHPERRKK